MIKSILDSITGRSLAESKRLVSDRDIQIRALLNALEDRHGNLDKLLNRIEDKDTELDCAFWWIDQQAIALKREKEQFALLANYVDRLASAIAGTEVKVFESDNIDAALEDAIASALEQNSQLLHTRIKLAELKEIVKQIPSD